MAPVPFVHPVRYPPLVLAVGYLSSTAYFAYAVGNSLYTSYKSLGPVSNTRSRIDQRRRFIPWFAGLAITAFSVAIYYSVRSATLSYKTWAYEHGLDLAQRLLGEDGGFISDADNSSRLLYIAHWLSNTPVYHEGLEIVAEKARRFWWGQQIDLGITAFSLMLATEGHRRNIPMRSAFLALAHLVNLSFAQNLFFLALLLTPSPLPPGAENLKLPATPLPTSTWTRLRNRLTIPTKPNGWAPHVMVFYATTTLNIGLTLIPPHVTGTSAFTMVTLLGRASTFLPVLLPRVTPVGWGSIQQRPHGTFESLTKLFKFLSAGALTLHVGTTVVALVSNAPGSHYHRHSALLPWDIAERSLWEQSTTAFGKILGSTNDHPVVAAVGWDVVLCGLSVGIWAAARNTNARDMMNSSIPFYHSALSSFKWWSPEKGGPRNDILNFLESEGTELKHERDHGNGTALQSRAEASQPHVDGVASSSDENEKVRRSNRPSNRRRMQSSKPPRRTVADNMDEKSSSRSERQPGTKRATEDKAYAPTSAVAMSALDGSSPPPQDLDWESASLAWGLAAFGGLASACCGVFGGECTSR
ncbi:hypothetical protein SAMD00023353_1701820 [Rosellinia necatrix]|uniref:Alpha-mannosyltransferase alg11p n=1 Tax=Rosellinia necatrix TaxID=77044 RepID=A0A1W2TJR1_ROSNE|nr:hypothetical protein SAMD00023353_1701820 [Rosellinia necatrix]